MVCFLIPAMAWDSFLKADKEEGNMIKEKIIFYIIVLTSLYSKGCVIKQSGKKLHFLERQRFKQQNAISTDRLYIGDYYFTWLV